ncbi:hypothetical protein KY285_005285 [Solanum tuberosum]|nr:hypothetical protein KY285_005285 [Solanum tuberosum]
MTRTRSMATLHKAPVSPSASLEKRPSSSKKKNTKKARHAFPKNFTADDSLMFWGLEHKIRFASFSKRPILPGRVINLEQLEASHCAVSTFFCAQKLSLLLCLRGLKLLKEIVLLFYANLRISADSCEWETLVLGNHIVLNDYLFKEVFGSDFSDDIPFMHGNVWPDQFEISLEDAKIFVAETGSDLSNFGPLSFGFENHILAHIVATTLVPRKGSLSNISNIDVLVLYCLLKKHSINWPLWFRNYMIESVEDSNPLASFPYGLLISRIIVDSLVDLSKYMADTPKATRISADSAALLLKEAEHIKVRLAGLETHKQVLQDTLGRVLQLHKDSSTDVGKLRLEVGGLKKDVIRSVNTILKKVNSIKTGADSAHNKLVVLMHTSYSTLSKTVERSLNTFCKNVLNTLKGRKSSHNIQKGGAHKCSLVQDTSNMARSTRNATNRVKLKMLHHIGSKPIREIIYQKGGKDDNPPNLTTIFFETRKKDNKLVEPEAIEKHAQLEEIVQADPSLHTIEIVEKCCGPQTRRHVFGFGGGVKAKIWKVELHQRLNCCLRYV